MSGVSVRLEVMRKWSEVCSGVTNVLSVEQWSSFKMPH